MNARGPGTNERHATRANRFTNRRTDSTATATSPDPLAVVLSEAALAALERRIESAVDQRLHKILPATLMQAHLSPWLDAKNAAAYLGISENALRLRVREALVPTHRDTAGRLRFHRHDLDRSMSPEQPRRTRR